MELNAYLFGFIYFMFCCNKVFGDVIEMRTDDFKPLFKTAASEFSHHEIVKPVIYKGDRQLPSTKDKMGHHSEVTIKFHTATDNFVIDLIRNRHLFSKAYVEKGYKDENNYKLTRPHHKKLYKHCFYHGHVRGAPNSMVALSTCYGISGYIQSGRDVFHIEPAFDIDKYSHRLYKDEHSLSTHRTCGAHHIGPSIKRNETIEMEHKKDVFKRMRRSVQQPYDANINTRYVEMYVVNDYRTFESNGRNEEYQIMKTQNIINIVSRLYQPFNIYIALVGIENWMVQDLFSITQEADTTLENFLHYRKSRINPKHQNDNAQLITSTNLLRDTRGIAKSHRGAICTVEYSGGVSENLATEGQTATTIAHELGHNFGMDHDNYTICQCKEEKCIMAATSGGINTPTHWSSCSMLALQEAFEMGMDYCLRNLPEQLYEGPVCRNGFLEEGEECDCGMPEDCLNKCCNASTCKLTPGSMCASGGCCDLNTCKPKAAATLCRPSVGDCDLPEFCKGDNPRCPADVFLQDGVDCYSGQSYCYKGQCKTHTGQCKLLWGSTGRVSDPVCFKHLNSNGSKHGNCGYNWTKSTYEPCQRENVMCGLLHCVHQNEKLMFWKDNLAHATPATFLTIGPQTYVCRGAMLDVGLDMPDPGMVPDGAKCDNRKICVDHKCTALSHLNISHCSSGCSDRGVCNSNGNCHCDEGWGGPECDEAGNGGSVDSGPIKINDDKSLLIGLLVFFLVVVPLLGVLAFIAYFFRATIFAWWNDRFNMKYKGQDRPLRPARPPPKREHSPVRQAPQRPQPTDTKPLRPQPARPQPPVNNNNRTGLSVKVSDPVLTGTTHSNTKSHVKPSPVPTHKPALPKPPLKPNKGASNQSEFKTEANNETPPAESKSRFGPIFKIPSFSKSDKQGAQNLKPEAEKAEEAPVANIVKKRELTRNISNPVLISTTDRRSKHLVKLENLNVTAAPSQEDFDAPPPPVPPKVSLANEYENTSTTRRNRPLPPRPMSMPESECGDDVHIGVKDGRKSAVLATGSPRMPQRPPPPPVKPNVDNTRKMLEDELSKLDDINIEIPRDSPEKQLPNNSSSPAIKPKNMKPKPRTTVSKSVDTKKSLHPKTAANKAKSDTKPNPAKWADNEKPIFNPKARPGLSSKSKQASQSSNLKPSEPTRKPSTESLDDDPDAGAASVAGLAQRFEVQKKPLLSDRNVKRTQSQGAAKAPMTPPKPKSGVKQIRSVDV
ncbi:disintegrin and metalloproteinase domain-containing protein 12-like isoform X3 [Mercenaria mercenaria]|uniref:disintegrin and metalloproteinase domain-containing protein 12-like isoform X3 n=1 Tax=Mercenaria mercenaria TaxID=6596 RepID=UPI00234EFF76|nr:disintegrin and metalloproteinase domain-containing protein 12-like isoform X3 [Mercenaria mercenaria]